MNDFQIVDQVDNLQSRGLREALPVSICSEEQTSPQN